MKKPLALFMAANLLCSFASLAWAAEQPNFIVFLTDDQGWGDLACYGHPIIKSPNLDAFAKQSVRFTQAYSACGVCSPSRSAILTGRTPYRNGVWRWIPDNHEVHLKASEITIATLLKPKGYDTCHAGKWHLNGKFNSPDQPQPNQHGYDHWLATQNNAAPNHLNPTNYVRNGQPAGKLEGPSAMIAVNEVIGWLKGRADKTKPFFITVWTHEPHLPIETAEKYLSLYHDVEDADLRQHHGNVSQMDDAFGTLMQAIDGMKYTDTTAVFYTSDNGPEGNGQSGRTRGSTGGLRGRKRADFEGGIRVPGMFRYPALFQAKNIQAGTVSDVPIIGHDIFSTVCELAQVPLPADRVIDGVSILPALQGQALTRTQPFYWRTHISPKECRVAVRVDDWKIVADEKLANFMLFNVKEDPQEKNDLAATETDRLAKLKQLLLSHDKAVRTEGDTLNAAEDVPAKAPKKNNKKKAA